MASSLTAVLGLCFCRKCSPLLRHVEQHGFIIMILYLLGYADALGCILPVLFSASHFNPRNESVTTTRGINLSSYETDATIVEMELWHVAGRWLSRDWRNNDGYMPCRIPRNIGGTPKNASEWPKKDRPNIKRRCWELQRLGVDVRASLRRKIWRSLRQSMAIDRRRRSLRWHRSRAEAMRRRKKPIAATATCSESDQPDGVLVVKRRRTSRWSDDVLAHGGRSECRA